MNASLAQQLSLVSYGNEFIKTGTIEPGYNSSDIFKYCKQVSFKTYKDGLLGKKKTIDAGNDPLEWLHFIKEDGCRELKILYQGSKDQEKYKDFQLAGFVGGGGDWFIEAINEKHSDFWYSHWNFENDEAEEKRGWRVQYEAVMRKKKPIRQQVELDIAKKELLHALTAIKEFASNQQLEQWAEWFDNALQALQSEKPQAYYPLPMLIEKNYSLTALQLVYGAAKSWVFGGMGSWNDIGFAETATIDRYDRLTVELYEAVLKAIVAGVNS